MVRRQRIGRASAKQIEAMRARGEAGVTGGRHATLDVGRGSACCALGTT